MLYLTNDVSGLSDFSKSKSKPTIKIKQMALSLMVQSLNNQIRLIFLVISYRIHKYIPMVLIINVFNKIRFDSVFIGFYIF